MKNNKFDILNYDIAKFDVAVEFNYHFYDETLEDIQPINDEDIDLKLNNINMNMSNKITISLKDLKERVFFDSNILFIDKINDKALEMLKLFQFRNLNFVYRNNEIIPDNYLFNSNNSFEDKSINFINNINQKNLNKIFDSFDINNQKYGDLTMFNHRNITYGTDYLTDIVKFKQSSQYACDLNFDEFLSGLKTLSLLNNNEFFIIKNENISNENVTKNISVSEGEIQRLISNRKSTVQSLQDNDDKSILMQFKPFLLSQIFEDETEIKNQTGVAFVGFLIKKNVKDPLRGTKFNAASQFVYVDFKDNTNNEIILYDGLLNYTHSYSYEISPVFYLGLYNFNGYDIYNFPLITHSLVYTNSKYTQFINSVDYYPPEPPNALIAKFKPKLFKAELSWCHPTNPQNDVIGFQIYRRKNLFESFKLIKMYLTKDITEFKYMNFFADRIEDKSIIKLSDTRGLDIDMYSFIDDEVNLTTDTYIYAVCSVDAHGYVSNYSSQIGLRYSKIYNSLIVDQVSVQNAPRTYPNLYVQRKSQLFEYDDLAFDFIPTFKNKEKIKVYFTPDALTLRNKTNHNQKLKVFDTNNSYELSITRMNDLNTKNIKFKLK